MSTAEEALAATMAHRDQAQSLNAVKCALANAEARDAGIKAREAAAGFEPVGWPFIEAYIGLRLSDLKSVVEQAEGRALQIESVRERVLADERDEARAELATEQAANKLEVEALQAELAAEIAKHLATLDREKESEERVANLIADVFEALKERDAARLNVPTAEHVVLLRSDYEKLIASLPAGPRGLR